MSLGQTLQLKIQVSLGVASEFKVQLVLGRPQCRGLLLTHSDQGKPCVETSWSCEIFVALMKTTLRPEVSICKAGITLLCWVLCWVWLVSVWELNALKGAHARFWGPPQPVWEMHGFMQWWPPRAMRIFETHPSLCERCLHDLFLHVCQVTCSGLRHFKIML